MNRALLDALERHQMGTGDDVTILPARNARFVTQVSYGIESPSTTADESTGSKLPAILELRVAVQSLIEAARILEDREPATPAELDRYDAQFAAIKALTIGLAQLLTGRELDPRVKRVMAAQDLRAHK